MKNRFLAYALGQALSYGIDVGTFALLWTVLGLGHPVMCNIMAKSVSAVFSFSFHYHYSFAGNKTNSPGRSALAFIATVLGNMILVSLMFWGLIVVLPDHEFVAKIVADIAGALLTYFVMRDFVFRRVLAL